MRRVQDELVNALSQLRKPLWLVYDADSLVARLPRTTAVVGTVNASDRDADVHPLGIGGVTENRVQDQATVSRDPAWTMRMIKEPAHEGPCLTGVAGFEERSRFHSAIHQLIVGAIENDLPDVVQRSAAVWWKLHVGFQRIGPGLAEVVARSKIRSPVIVRGRPQAVTTLAVVVGHRVHAVSVKIGPGHVPACALGTRAQKKRALRRPDQQQYVAAADSQMVDTADHRRDVTRRPSRWFGARYRSRFDRVQRRFHLAGALIPICRLLREAALDDRPEAGRHLGGQRWWRLVKDQRADLEGGVPTERRPPSGSLVQHDAERPQITAGVARLAAQHFRRHVTQ